jgi:intracellular septation protein
MKWFKNFIEEVGPVIVLGVVNGATDNFELAVGAMVITMVITVAVVGLVDKDWPWFAILSTAGVGLFAGLSFLFGDSSLFAISDTILDGGLGLLILWSLRWDETLLSKLFSRTFAITDKAWRILTVRWGVLLVTLAVLNEVVRQIYDPSVWVSFKVYATIFILLFGCYQFTVSMRERIPHESNWLGLRNK